MRKKKLAKNTISSLIFQVTTIVCGFILPRLILLYYGSETNGLVNSITQLLSIISFLELGVGAVVQSSLYKPLSKNDSVEVSKIVKSANKFFRTLAKIMLVYVGGLILFFPFISNQSYNFAYTATLILAMSISSFAQYYFGIVNRLLLLANQKGYIQYNVQTVTLIANTAACAVIISQGASIQFVKLTTSLIYLIRPILLQIYVDRNYQIDKKIEYKEEPIKQKWNGVAQHVAAVVLDGTDTIVLTVFSSLSNVSIYSVYHLVIYGVKQLFTSMTNGIQSLMGELWARQKLDELRDFFGWVEWSIHTGAVLVFSCTGALVVSFIGIYTNCVTDANYIQPLFAVLLVLANAVHCLRMPYNLMILAGGHYKQTQNNYIVAAIMNITVSIVLVKAAGLIGVAIGTLVAMLYQTVWMANYDSKNLICWPLRKFMKQIFVDVLSVVCFSFCVRFLNLQAQNYLQWIYNAVKVVTVAVAITGVINWIFYRDKEKKLLSKIIKR